MVLEGVLEDRWKVAPLIHRPAMELVTSAVLPLPPTSPLGGSQPKGSERGVDVFICFADDGGADHDDDDDDGGL
jgi:hypothetical protein